MMKNKITFLVPGIMLGMSVIAAETAVSGASPDLTVRLVNVGRQEILKDSDKEVGEANKMVLAGKYDEAIAIYNRVAGNLQKYPGETSNSR